jgi:hypothetical protein
MATSAREIVGWTNQQWAAVEDAVGKALARTAKCRLVVPMGPDQIGERAVVVPHISAGAPLRYDADTIASPVHVYVNVRLDDDHADNGAAVLRLIAAGASQLGALEDVEIVQGAPVGGAGPPGRVIRNVVLAGERVGLHARRDAAMIAAVGAGTTAIGAGGGAVPTGQQIITAIATAIADLETVDRPGPCGLLLHNRMLRVLHVPPVAGAAPLVPLVEQLIGSSEIAGTSALDGSLVPGNVCGILLRLEPAAIDLVQTQKPAVTVLDRVNGQINLRIEEEIVVRMTDQTAVHRIVY